MKRLGAVLATVMLAACATAFVPSSSSTVYLGTGSGHGSGVIVADGVILTAAHVATKGLTAEYDDGQTAEVTRAVGWEDPDLPAPDIAIVYADTFDHPAVTVRCDDPDPGDRVWIMGHPYALRFALSDGVVSTLRPIQSPTKAYYGKYYMTDAVVMPGSSGGPVFDEYGSLVGIATAQMGMPNVGAAYAVIQSPSLICEFLDAHGVER